jgi:hypothetical protein
MRFDAVGMYPFLHPTKLFLLRGMHGKAKGARVRKLTFFNHGDTAARRETEGVLEFALLTFCPRMDTDKHE